MVLNVRLIINSIEHSGVGKFAQKAEKVIVQDLSMLKVDRAQLLKKSALTEGVNNKTTTQMLFEKGFSLTQVKEAYRIRNKKVEYHTSLVLGQKPHTRTDNFEGKVRGFDIPFVNTQIHNHPQHLTESKTLKSFSDTDIENFLVSDARTSLVSTRDELFRLSKPFFGKKKINIDDTNIKEQLTNFDKTMEHLDFNSGEKIKYKLQKLTGLSFEEMSKLDDKAIEKMYQEIGETKFLNWFEKFEKYPVEIEKVEIARDRLFNFLNDKMIKRVAEEIDAKYSKHTWEELLPNILKSRGKKEI